MITARWPRRGRGNIARFEQWTRELAARRGRLMVVEGNNALVTAVVQTEISHAFPVSRAGIGAIYTRSSVPTLPPDLAD